jgi:hypothetical protein
LYILVFLQKLQNPKQKRSCITVVAFWALFVFSRFGNFHHFDKFRTLKKLKLFCLGLFPVSLCSQVFALLLRPPMHVLMMLRLREPHHCVGVLWGSWGMRILSQSSLQSSVYFRIWCIIVHNLKQPSCIWAHFVLLNIVPKIFKILKTHQTCPICYRHNAGNVCFKFFFVVTCCCSSKNHFWKYV